MARITGGCLCGAVKYSTDAEAIRTVVCHCTICQRHVGSAFATLMAFPAGSIAVSGKLKTYTEPGGTSGEPFHRRFCADCGTPIIYEREGGERTSDHGGNAGRQDHHQAQRQSVLRLGTGVGADHAGYPEPAGLLHVGHAGSGPLSAAPGMR